jgi:hypothetical protein
MKMRTLLIINAVVEVIFGLGFVFAPAVLLGLFGAQIDATGTALAHVAGGVILSLSIISWLGKDLDGSAQEAIAWGGVFFSHFVAGISVLLAILNGTFNAIAWSAVIMDVLFVAAFFWVRGNKAK